MQSAGLDFIGLLVPLLEKEQKIYIIKLTTVLNAVLYSAFLLSIR